MRLGVRKITWALATGAITLFLTLYWRGFPYRLAVLSSLMVALLTYSAVQATERLRRIYRQD